MKYDRFEDYVADAGTVITYRTGVIGAPEFSASLSGVARYGGTQSSLRGWCWWQPERLDMIPAHYRLPLCALAIEQCRRMAAGRPVLERWEEEEWLASHGTRAA